MQEICKSPAFFDIFLNKLIFDKKVEMYVYRMAANLTQNVLNIHENLWGLLKTFLKMLEKQEFTNDTKCLNCKITELLNG